MPNWSGSMRLIACVAIIGGVPVLGGLMAPPQSGQAAVVFDPRLDDTDLALAAVQAGAQLVRYGNTPGLVVVELPQDGPQALREVGAWLILDPIIVGGCTASTDTLQDAVS